ncbi:alpha/beta hydrolase fold domain-containing protein, partial [Streptacidiphilus anmyonensis]|uniref:alpha/beta hydrolase fold domain-containing protein n=1 Tax=Streptacidiphilus anmyonensis TaxID=405782 RepID=UPI00128D3AC5
VVLVYPVLDALPDTADTAGTPDAGSSVTRFATGYFHTAAHQRWYWQQYLGPDGDPRHPLASPGRAPDLSGLPPTLVVLADCDLLRDEGLRYARRLGAAGVRVQVHLHPGVFHGFLGCLGALPAADDALDALAHWITRTR